MTGLNEGKRAVIYARVSTKGQADSGVSIETQLKVCRQWCQAEGVEVVGEFHDDGISGTTTNRDEFAAMIATIISQDPDFLVVYDTSRITREGNDKYNKLVQALEGFKCGVVYPGMGGITADSQAARFVVPFKTTTDSILVKESTSKTRESVNRLIEEGVHVSRSAGFVFEEDIPLMPKGRVLLEDRVREKKDPDGAVVRTVTKATVIASEKDFFALVDRGASIEVIAEMWGLGRHCLTDAVKGKSRCVREKCPIPDRYPEYVRRLKAAKDAGICDPVFEPYRKTVRARASKERAQCRAKATERRADGNKGSESLGKAVGDDGKKGVVQ
ncbi:recombinase family protein [Candidatus Methanarcanum hacksteinii]|uniref:recombinase family protein n=1 Tax=Candidatus Methanarcanum hacksteinii TaxID=2911857 RepID=UPI0037DC21B5